jgi:hypothetical protein
LKLPVTPIQSNDRKSWLTAIHANSIYEPIWRHSKGNPKRLIRIIKLLTPTTDYRSLDAQISAQPWAIDELVKYEEHVTALLQINVEYLTEGSVFQVGFNTNTKPEVNRTGSMVSSSRSASDRPRVNAKLLNLCRDAEGKTTVAHPMLMMAQPDRHVMLYGQAGHSTALYDFSSRFDFLLFFFPRPCSSLFLF